MVLESFRVGFGQLRTQVRYGDLGKILGALIGVKWHALMLGPARRAWQWEGGTGRSRLEGPGRC